MAAKGERTKMTIENLENATKDAPVGAQSATVAPGKAASKKAASPKKGAPKSQKSAKAAKAKPAAAAKARTNPAKTGKAPKSARAKTEGVRGGSKTSAILELLHRAKGATLADIMEATSWQAHSVRGFISGTLGKKMGLTVKSEKREDGTRVYSVAK
jgi:Protein of unknown function (DUF3489)